MLTEIPFNCIDYGVVGPSVLVTYDSIPVMQIFWDSTDNITLEVWTGLWV